MSFRSRQCSAAIAERRGGDNFVSNVVGTLPAVTFASQAAGSVIGRNGKPVHLALIGQKLSDPKYFWGRLSAV